MFPEKESPSICVRKIPIYYSTQTSIMHLRFLPVTHPSLQLSAEKMVADPFT